MSFINNNLLLFTVASTANLNYLLQYSSVVINALTTPCNLLLKVGYSVTYLQILLKCSFTINMSLLKCVSDAYELRQQSLFLPAVKIFPSISAFFATQLLFYFAIAKWDIYIDRKMNISKFSYTRYVSYRAFHFKRFGSL
jgi:hypothetical protein